MVFNRLTSSLLFVFILIVVAAKLDGPIQQCSLDSVGEIITASVNTEYKNGYYTFNKGKTALLEFQFQLKEDVPTLHASITITRDGATHTMKLRRHDVCKIINCPVKKDTIHTYQNSMLVHPKMQSIKIDKIQYSLVDPNGTTVACVSLPMMVA